jgi:hypothetical protein
MVRGAAGFARDAGKWDLGVSTRELGLRDKMEEREEQEDLKMCKSTK